MNTKRKLRLFGLVLATICAAVFAVKKPVPTNRLDDKEFQRRLTQALPGNSRAVLDNATKITLFSLDGSFDYHLSPTSRPGQFHGYPILGQTVLVGSEKHHVLTVLYDGLVEDAFSSACWNPHHGLRAVQGRQNVDFVICFSCSHMVSYAGRAKGGSHIGRQPEKYFNQLLTAAGVPFAPDYKP